MVVNKALPQVWPNSQQGHGVTMELKRQPPTCLMVMRIQCGSLDLFVVHCKFVLLLLTTVRSAAQPQTACHGGLLALHETCPGCRNATFAHTNSIQSTGVQVLCMAHRGTVCVSHSASEAATKPIPAPAELSTGRPLLRHAASSSTLVSMLSMASRTKSGEPPSNCSSAASVYIAFTASMSASGKILWK